MTDDDCLHCIDYTKDDFATQGRRYDLILLFGPLLSMGPQRFGNVLVKPNQADLLVLKELSESGKVRPVIDRRFALSEVSSAVRYVEDGHARGKVVVTL